MMGCQGVQGRAHTEYYDELTRCCVWCEVQVFARDEKR